MKVVAYQAIPPNRLENSEGNSVNFENLQQALDFLLERFVFNPSKEPPCYRVTWDADRMIALVLKLLPLELAQRLHKKGSCEFATNGKVYNIWHRREKGFSIRQLGTKLESTVYHLSQFFPDDMPEPANLAEVESYTRYLFDEYKRMGFVNLDNLYSPISAIKKFLRHMDFPTVNDLPGEVAEMAVYCGGKQWLEAHQIGHWDTAYDYDLTCYSEDTEALTSQGWKRITELQRGETILAFCPEDNKCRFEPITKMSQSFYVGEMISIETQHVSMVVTPNHRVLLQNRNRCKQSKSYKVTGKMSYAPWQVYEANKLPNGNFRMPISFPLVDKQDYEIEDDTLRLIAWVITEGWRQRYKTKKTIKSGSLSISQSEIHRDNCVEIAQSMNALNLSHSISSKQGRKHIEHHFYVHSRDSEKILPKYADVHHIPQWILQLCSRRQLQLFLDTLIKGDGSSDFGKKTYYTKSKILADSVMNLCQLLGYKSSITRLARSREYYAVNINDRNSPNRRENPNCEVVTFGRVKGIPYKGYVACPTVHSGFIVVRRNHKAFICGNSAYPNVLARCPDFRLGDWVSSKEMPDNAMYGYAKGRVRIKKSISPIIYQKKGEVDISPKGSWPDYLTMQEIQTIRRWKIGSFEIEKAYWWIPREVKYPMAHFLWRLQRARPIDKVINHNAKAMLTGFYGYMGYETDYELGEFNNPVWFAEATAQTRCNVADFIYKHRIRPIHIAVDGVLTPKEIKFDPEDSKLGWKLSYNGEAVVLSSGIVYIATKRPGGLNLSDLKQLIDSNPESCYWETQQNKILTLGEGAEYDALDHVGEVLPYRISVDLNIDRDRAFKRLPQNGVELLTKRYKSRAYEVKE